MVAYAKLHCYCRLASDSDGGGGSSSGDGGGDYGSSSGVNLHEKMGGATNIASPSLW